MADSELADFSDWLVILIETPKFLTISKEFSAIQLRLNTESVGPIRSALLDRISSLSDDQ